eukprot:g3964.t1
MNGSSKRPPFLCHDCGADCCNSDRDCAHLPSGYCPIHVGGLQPPYKCRSAAVKCDPCFVHKGCVLPHVPRYDTQPGDVFGPGWYCNDGVDVSKICPAPMNGCDTCFIHPNCTQGAAFLNSSTLGPAAGGLWVCNDTVSTAVNPGCGFLPSPGSSEQVSWASPGIAGRDCTGAGSGVIVLNSTSPLVAGASCEVGHKKKACTRTFLCQLIPSSSGQEAVGLRAAFIGESDGCSGPPPPCIGGCVGKTVTSGCSDVQIDTKSSGKCCFMSGSTVQQQ